MKKHTTYITFALLFIYAIFINMPLSATAATQNTDQIKMQKVQTMLNKKYKSQNYGIYIQWADSDKYSANINGSTTYVAASTGKLPAIYYTQKLLNEKKINLKTNWKYVSGVNSFKGAYSPWGAGVMPKSANNKNYSVQSVLQNTIKYSDNVGANMLGYYATSRFNKPFINEINRITGRKWTQFQLRASAKDNAKLMKAIYKIGGVANTYLQSTVYDKQRIPKYLPVKVGHKIGDVDHYRHDVAIVYAKKPYIISIMTKNWTTYEQISKISKDVYDILK